MHSRFRQIPTSPDFALAGKHELHGAVYRVCSVSPAFTQSSTPTLVTVKA